MENDPFIDDVPIKMVIFHGKLLNNQRVASIIVKYLLIPDHHHSIITIIWIIRHHINRIAHTLKLSEICSFWRSQTRDTIHQASLCWLQAPRQCLAGSPASRFNCFWLQPLDFISFEVSMGWRKKTNQQETWLFIARIGTFPATFSFFPTQWNLTSTKPFAVRMPKTPPSGFSSSRELTLDSCPDFGELGSKGYLQVQGIAKCLHRFYMFLCFFFPGKHRNFEVFTIFGAI